MKFKTSIHGKVRPQPSSWRVRFLSTLTPSAMSIWARTCRRLTASVPVARGAARCQPPRIRRSLGRWACSLMAHTNHERHQRRNRWRTWNAESNNAAAGTFVWRQSFWNGLVWRGSLGLGRHQRYGLDQAPILSGSGRVAGSGGTVSPSGLGFSCKRTRLWMAVLECEQRATQISLTQFGRQASVFRSSRPRVLILASRFHRPSPTIPMSRIIHHSDRGRSWLWCHPIRPFSGNRGGQTCMDD